ncbi:MAG: 30S ribosomal protein S19e [archaeon]
MRTNDVPTNALIERVAKKLQTKIKAPDWSVFVKTGVHKQRPPQRDDWWYVRAAAILRTISLKGPIGVSKIRTKYGGRKNRGMKPERHMKASGHIVRTILQQFEQQKLTKQGNVELHKGRIITKEGQSLLDKSAAELAKEIAAAKPKVEKKEHKVEHKEQPKEEQPT